MNIGTKPAVASHLCLKQEQRVRRRRRWRLFAVVAASCLLLGQSHAASRPNEQSMRALAEAPAMAASGAASPSAIQQSTLQDFTFISSYDNSNQWATLQVPSSAPPVNGYPLIIALHGWMAGPSSMISWFGAAADTRGWLLAAPNMHGERTSGETSLAARAAQRDVVDTLAWVRARYPVDNSRVYISGLSMGGMAATTTAAKYPDVFAAAIDFVGITDLSAWYTESPAQQGGIAMETGGTPTQVPFEYQRRSPLALAGNLKHVPLAIVYGTSDTIVLPHHANDLYQAVLGVNPDHVELNPFVGGHEVPGTPYNADWALDFLAQYPLNPSPSTLRIKTDESKPYYWLGINQTGGDHWTAIDAITDNVQQQITLVVNDSQSVVLTIDLSRLRYQSNAPYQVQDLDLDTKASSNYAVSPTSGKVGMTVGAGNHQLTLISTAPRSLAHRLHLPIVLIRPAGGN